MDRTSKVSGRKPTAPDADSIAASSKVEGTAMAAHETVDRIADKATAQVDRLSGTAHRAVNTTADTTTSEAELISTFSKQAKEAQTRFTETACTSILHRGQDLLPLHRTQRSTRPRTR